MTPSDNRAQSSDGTGGSDRLLDLVCDEVLCELSDVDRDELATFPRALIDRERASLGAAAARLEMGLLSDAEYRPLPASVEAKLLAEAEKWAQDRRSQMDGLGDGPIPIANGAQRKSEPRLAAWTGWIAAAAALAFAAIVALRSPENGIVATPGAVALVEPRVRDEFLAKQGDAFTVEWGDWESQELGGVAFKGVRGDVCWSDSAQKGFMRFANLPVNDPTKEQYQLWIIDERGLGQRISGGVFNAAANGETVVEIEPGIAVRSAAAFAVTVEKPRGQWVSDMTKRVVLAAKKS